MRRLLVPIVLFVSLLIVPVADGAPRLQQVTVETEAGTFKLYTEVNPNGPTPLQGVQFTADLTTSQGALSIMGGFHEGSLESGEISGSAAAKLAEAYSLVDDGLYFTLSSAKVEIVLQANQLTKSSLEIVGVDAMLPLGVNSPTFLGSGAGTLEQGTLDLECTLQLQQYFEYERGDVSVKLQPGSQLSLQVIDSKFSQAVLLAPAVEVRLPAQSNDILAQGTVDVALNQNGDLQVSGMLTLSDGFAYSAGQVKANLAPGGNVVVSVERSKVVSAKLLSINVEASFELATGILNLRGSTDGELGPSGALSFNSNLSPQEHFDYHQGDLSSSLKPGDEIQLTIQSGKLTKVLLMAIPMEVTVKTPEGPLVLIGSPTGDMHPQNGGITFDALLQVAEEFDYQQGDVSAKLNPNEPAQVAVEASQFKRADLAAVAVEVEANLGGQSVSLAGDVTGVVRPGGSLDFQSELVLMKPFSYQSEAVEVSLEQGGKVAAQVEANQLQSVTFQEIPTTFALHTDSGELMLVGAAQGEISDDGGLNLQALLSVTESFNYEKNDVATVLQPGQSATYSIVEGIFQGLILPDLEVSVLAPAENREMALSGVVDGLMSADGNLAFAGTLSLETPFVYKKGLTTVTLQSGSLFEVSLEAGSEILVELISTTVQVNLPLGDITLQLEGTVNGEVNHTGELTLIGHLQPIEDFEYQNGDVTITLSENDSLGLELIAGNLSEISFENLQIQVVVPLDNNNLVLAGAVDGLLSPDGEITFTSPLTINDPFDYENGEVKASLKPGLTVELELASNRFVRAMINSLQIEVDSAVAGSELQLQGEGDATIGPEGLLDFQGAMILAEPFEYRRGPVNVTLPSGGGVTVTIEQSEFKWASLEQQPFEAVLMLPLAQSADLTGSIDRGLMSRNWLSLRAEIYLEHEVLRWLGGRITVVEPSEGTLILLRRIALLRIGRHVFVVRL